MTRRRVSFWRALGRLLSVGIGLTGVLALLPSLAPGQPLGSATQDPVAGARVFGAKGCNQCHAVRGLGGTVGPDLSRVARPRTFYDLAAALWNHAPRMADRMRQLGIARPKLDPRDTGDLVAFLFTLDYFDPPGNAETGRRLFTEKRCIVCHQVGGVGGVGGPNLDGLRQHESPIHLATAMWNHGPQMAEAMRARGLPRPTFKDTELIDLIAYIRSASTGPRTEPVIVLPGRAEEGRRLFAERRCTACHTIGGGAGPLGPDLAERGAHQSLTGFAAAMWNKAPAMMEAMKARAIPVPQLRAEEMADLVAYLYAVRYFAQAGQPARGLRIAAAKGCFGCHALPGERARSAPNLGAPASIETPAAVLSALWNHSFIGDPQAERHAWAELAPDEMRDLIAYLRSLRGTR